MSLRKVTISEGTLDGRLWVYEFRYNGKKYKSRKFKTKSEAEAAEIEFRYNLTKQGDPSKMTLGDLFEDHYNYQKDKVKFTTLTNYEKKQLHFNSIAKIILDKMTINDIEKWKREVNDKDLATRTKNDLMKYLKSVLNYGMKWYDFDFRSIYSKMSNFSNPNEPVKEMQFYTYNEFKKFICVEGELKFKALFETLYYCGLRRGELRGLTWNRVDLDNKELIVDKNVVNVKGESGYWLITTPKTPSSIRKIPIPEVLLKDLKQLKKENENYYGFNNTWFVFGDVNPIHPDTLRRRKNDNAEKAGVKQIRLHDFRHSCASLLINNGANITIVAKYLGHTKIEETLNTYSHMFKSALDNVVETINKIAA